MPRAPGNSSIEATASEISCQLAQSIDEAVGRRFPVYFLLVLTVMCVIPPTPPKTSPSSLDPFVDVVVVVVMTRDDDDDDDEAEPASAGARSSIIKAMHLPGNEVIKCG